MLPGPRGPASGFELVSVLLIGSGALLEVAQPGTAPAELLSHGAHDRYHAIEGLVRVGGQGAAVAGDLLKLLGQIRLADPRITVNVEQESAPFIIEREAKVLFVLGISCPRRPTKPLCRRLWMRSCKNRRASHLGPHGTYALQMQSSI